MSAWYCPRPNRYRAVTRRDGTSPGARMSRDADTPRTERTFFGQPWGLANLFGIELWERFSFYSMLALFTLYLRDPNEGFGWTAAEATWLYSTYLMFVQLT